MSRGVFVTGTDTEIGKTHVSCTLLRGLIANDVAAVGMKPVASGARQTATGLRNEDAEALIAAAGFGGAYADVNPYVFADPIAPHLAARENAACISIAQIRAAHARLATGNRFVVVEGVGGWLAPLGDDLMQSDLVRSLDVPVILVVGMRLGCINHAVLTARAIAEDGCRLMGWIANRMDPDMLRFEANIESIRQRIHAPLLGTMDHAEDPAASIRPHALEAAVRMLGNPTYQTPQSG
ncbi:dethiobiotin synthase [Dokdonella sp.]|uniref:dethiobiotin synthase n=1 Tax=Dokdonella sp. TaxID=2291710 RepID=UPI003527D6EC